MKARVYLAQCNNRFGDNVHLPYSVGILWAYAQTFEDIRERYELVDLLYHKEPIDDALARLHEPQLLGLSSYIWNHRWNLELARRVHLKWPMCVIVMGGPHIPNEPPADWFVRHPQIEFLVHGEGEAPFAQLLQRLLIGPAGWTVKTDPAIPGVSMDHHRSGVIQTTPAATPPDPSEIPSPYLTGVFDRLMEREEAPAGGTYWQAPQETHRGCAYRCFAAGTWMALPDRLLRVGHHDDAARVVYQGSQDCVALDLENGLSLTVTPNHKIFVVRDDQIEQVPAGEIAAGEHVVIQVGQNVITDAVKLPALPPIDRSRGGGRRIPNDVRLPDVFNEDIAWLCGYIIGDGCLPADGRSSVPIAVKPKLEDRLRDLVTRLFGIELHIHAASNTEKMLHGGIHSRRVVQFFTEVIGMGRLEDKLRVPDCVLQSPSVVVRAFLDGLYAADGYRAPGREPYLATVSERLAYEVAHLIHWIGDAANIHRVRAAELATREWAWRVEWHPRACRERKRGHPCIASSVPTVRAIYKSRKSGRYFWRTKTRRRIGVSRALLRKLDPEALRDPRLLADDQVYAQVTNIEEVAAVDVFDVHNHPTHVVGANGVLATNCTFCEWGSSYYQKVREFPTERVVAEFEWFAKHQIEFIENSDANYGLLKRDLEMTEQMVAIKARTGYPKRFRAAFAKNSGDRVFAISKLLFDAGMHKATTVALQSMDPQVLVHIKRKNIKDAIEPLLLRYRDAGIPTYSELILGLPGESLDTFKQGVDKVLQAGQHEALFIYNCVQLPNTPFSDPGYIAEHGIEYTEMQAMLLHATPEPGAVSEIQPTVTATATMPHADWIEGWMFAWAIHTFHCLGLTRHIAIQRHERLGEPYSVFYTSLLNYARAARGSVIWDMYDLARETLDRGLAGGSWDLVDRRFGGISWPPDEAAFLMGVVQLDRFYDDLAWCGVGRFDLADVVAEQRDMIVRPGDDLATYARELVWYGRKGVDKRLRRKEAS